MHVVNDPLLYYFMLLEHQQPKAFNGCHQENVGHFCQALNVLLLSVCLQVSPAKVADKY